MINLEEFVQSIHIATAAAGEALIQKNLDLIDRFFDEVDEEEAGHAIAHMASAGRSDAQVESDAYSPRSRKRSSSQSRQSPQRRRSDDNSGDYDDHDGNDIYDDIKLLKPKMVAMQYPIVTKDGPGIQTVNVPLISLVPLSQVQLKEMNFSTELELSVNGDALQVSFPKRTLKSQEMAEEGANMGNGGKAKLEVKICATETPDGLKYIVDGYERALRAQVPG